MCCSGFPGKPPLSRRNKFRQSFCSLQTIRKFQGEGLFFEIFWVKDPRYCENLYGGVLILYFFVFLSTSFLEIFSRGSCFITPLLYPVCVDLWLRKSTIDFLSTSNIRNWQRWERCDRNIAKNQLETVETEYKEIVLKNWKN